MGCFRNRTFQNLQQIADFEKAKRLGVLRIYDMESGQAPEIRPDLQAGDLLASRSALRCAWVSTPLRSAQDDTGGGFVVRNPTNA